MLNTFLVCGQPLVNIDKHYDFDHYYQNSSVEVWEPSYEISVWVVHEPFTWVTLLDYNLKKWKISACEASAYKNNDCFVDIDFAKKSAHNENKELDFTDLKRKKKSNSKKRNIEATSWRSVEKLA